MAPSAYIPPHLRQLVAERAKFRCEYCQLQQDLCPETFEVDHIIPRALGGQTEPDNLCYACPVCNNAERSHITAQDPQTGRRVRLFDPRRQRWNRHFRWSDDYGRALGKNVVGRATVEALAMNRPRVVHIRLLWAAMGLYPPSEKR
jgi:HNH endonuclease